jgi:hypothetical protein
MPERTDIGSYVPSTFIWDMNEIEDIDITSDKFRELLIRLYQNLNLMQNVLNVKESAYYDIQEFVNGQLYLTTNNEPRQVIRKMIQFGALPNTGVKAVAHGITTTRLFTFTRIYGASSDTTNMLYTPLPNTNIQILVDSTNITVTTGADYSSYDTTYIILEFLRY